MTDAEYRDRIDASFAEAARILELRDLTDDDEDLAMDVYEERHHCGTCEVRTVMEIVWPAVEDYIAWIRSTTSPLAADLPQISG